jgi:hypothetical protein
MAVEVKRWLEKTEQVDEHIKRMQLIRQYPPAEVKEKKLLGAEEEMQSFPLTLS